MEGERGPGGPAESGPSEAFAQLWADVMGILVSAAPPRIPATPAAPGPCVAVALLRSARRGRKVARLRRPLASHSGESRARSCAPGAGGRRAEQADQWGHCALRGCGRGAPGECERQSGRCYVRGASAVPELGAGPETSADVV